MLTTYRISSKHLNELRPVSVFIPDGRRDRPISAIYCADGQVVDVLAERFEELIHSRAIPPIALIGIHSVESIRAQEYLLGVDESRFEAHEHFLIDEIVPWSQSTFRVSPDRTELGVFGFSNGGTFAMSMGIRHPEIFGLVAAFSIARPPEQFAAAYFRRRPIPRFYLAAGTKEKPFRKTTLAIAKTLASCGVEHCYAERNTGHDFSFWEAELPLAVQWGFPTQSNKDVP